MAAKLRHFEVSKANVGLQRANSGEKFKIYSRDLNNFNSWKNTIFLVGIG